MNILITGGNGFVGSYMTEHCLNLGHKVTLIIRDHTSSLYHIEHIKDKIKLQYCDLIDPAGLYKLFSTTKFDIVFHFAARSFVPVSWDNPFSTYMNNIVGTSNLLEAIRFNKQDPKIIIVSSSEVYGQVLPEDVPIKENCPLRPSSPYAVSKVGEDFVAYQNWVSYNMNIVRSRLFTHSGPRQSDGLFMSAFTKQVAKISLGLQDPIVYVGNLDSVRTICDIRDAINAYWLMAEKCPAGEVYNVGGSTTKKVGEILNMIINISGIECKVMVDQRLLRPSDVTLQIPCTEKFRKQTGWQPVIPLETTLTDMLNYWKKELSR